MGFVFIKINLYCCTWITTIFPSQVHSYFITLIIPFTHYKEQDASKFNQILINKSVSIENNINKQEYIYFDNKII